MCLNAYPSQVFFCEAVMKLSTRSRCSSNCEHTSFLELKQLKETQRDSVLPSLPHQLFNRTTNSNYFSTSLYWGFPSSQRHSNSSSLLKERSEVTARLWRLPLRISQATCTAAPVTLGKRTTASHSELGEAYWSHKQQCVCLCVLMALREKHNLMKKHLQAI